MGTGFAMKTKSWVFNPEALNYDEAATDDDGSCEVLGCTHALANNYSKLPRMTMARASLTSPAAHALGTSTEADLCN